MVPESKKQRVQKGTAVHSKLCPCCSNEHSLEFCDVLKHKPHNDKLDFLKSKWLCYGCLVPGHLSKGCFQRLTCQTCTLKHPTVLHITDKSSLTPHSHKKFSADAGSNVTSDETCGFTGAGQLTCALATVPVRVNTKKSSQEVMTYAFLDTGSSATFCTEQLMKEL